jgi:hypothetical protein
MAASNFEESLLKKSEELLQDLSIVEEFTRNSEFTLKTEEAEKLQVEEMRAINDILGLRADGYIDTRISEDKMLCFIDFYPPSPDGNPISVDTVQNRLNELNIFYGIDWDAIKEAAFECNTENKEILDIPIARGTPPIDEVAEHFILNENFSEQDSDYGTGDEPRTDYKERNPFTIVHTGDTLAVLFEKKEGVKGRDIFGKELPYKVKKVPTYIGKENTVTEEKHINAAADGIFRIKGTAIWVEEILHIDGNIDYRTGNIDFPGNVFVNGYVEDGFKLHSGGSIFCKKTLHATDIKCEGDLEVEGGIIGRGDAQVTCGGMVRVKFIEKCHLEAGKDIFSEVGAINSIVQTLGHFSTSKKGIIIGGKVFAQNGVLTVNIGTPSSPKAEIICGTNYIVQRKLEWIRDKNVELALQLRDVKKNLDFSKTPGAELVALKDRLFAGITKLNEAAQILVHQLTKSENAKIVALGTVATGTFIEICHVPFIVPRPMKSVVFTLNKEKGRIDVTPYIPKDKPSKSK